jgi:[NiFe] hydrogenase assembly HybE family chaperone
VSAAPERPAAELALEALFRAVHETRMRDLPIANPRLCVEALGFRDWRGVQVGALVTPWSITIVIVPGAGGPGSVPRLATGLAQAWSFPSGEYEFHGHEAEGVGCYQQCSLFSPALEFDSQEAARTAARAALDALFATPAPPPPPESRRLSRRGLLFGG